MRKELVYSMMALGAFPVAVKAAEVNAQVAAPDVKGGWTNDAPTTDDIVTIATGKTSATVSLLPGSYTIKVTTLTGSVATMLSLEGVKETGDAAKKAIAAAGYGELKFTVEGTEAKNVTVNIEGDGSYSFSTVEITLDFDFDGDDRLALLKTNYGVMAALLNNPSNDPAKYTYPEKTDDLTGYAKSILEKIEAIQKATAENGYQIYKDNKLYEANPSSLAALQAAIDKAAADTKAKEIAYRYDNMSKDYQKLVTRFNKLPKAAQDQVNGKDETYDKDGKVTMTAVNTAIEDFKSGSSIDNSKVLASLNTLTSKIGKAEGANDANTTAYTDIKLAVANAVAEYTSQVDALYEALNGDNFKKLREEASELIQAEYQKILTVGSTNETKNTAGECATYKETLGITATEGGKAKNISGNGIANIGTTLTGYVTEIQTIVNNFKAAGKTVQDALDVVAAKQKALDDQKADKKTAAAIEADAKVKADAEAAQKLIDRLKTSVTNPTKAAVDKGDIAAALANEQYGTAEIQKAIDKLTTGDNRVNYDTHIANAKAIADQIDVLNKAIAEVNAYVKNAKDADPAGLGLTDYIPDTYWAKTITYLKKIEEEVAKEAKTYTDGNAKSYKLDAVNTSKTDVAKYLEHAKAAAAKYAEIKAKADKYTADLKAATDKVKNLDIYKDGSENVGTIAKGTSYEKFIASIQAKLDLLTSTAVKDKKIVGSLPRTLATVSSDDKSYKEEHYTEAMKLADDATIGEDIQKILDNYKADQDAWAAANQAKAIATLNAAIDELQNSLNTDLDKLKADPETQYGPGAKAVTDILATIVVPTETEQTDANKAELPVAELNKLVEKLNKAKTILDEAKAGVIKTAKDNVAAAAAATKAVADLQKDYDAKISTQGVKADKSAWKIDANALEATPQLESVKKVLDEFTAIQDSINHITSEKNIKGDANTNYWNAYQAQKLTADVYKADIESLKARITAAVAAADAAQANWKAKEDVLAEATKVQTALDKAISDAQASVDKAEEPYKSMTVADKNEAKTYVSKDANGVLGKEYQNILDAINKDNNDLYTKAQAVANKTALLNRLNELSAKVKTMTADLKAIIVAKLAQDKAYDATNARWNEVYTFISSQDQTSLLQTRQEEMAALKEQLLEQKAKIAADYQKGESVDNGVETKLAEIKAAIDKIKAAVEDTDAQDKQIKTDNADKSVEIAKAIAAAEAAYTKAAETIKDFSKATSTLITETLKANKIEDYSKTLETYPAKLKTLKDNANKAYNENVKKNETATPAVVFDATSYLTQAAQYKSEIETNEGNFIKSITDAIKDAVKGKVDAYQKLVDDAKELSIYEYDAAGKELTDEAKPNLFKTIFADANSLIADISIAFDDVDLLALDEALKAAEDGKKPNTAGVALAVLNGKNTGADYSLRVLLNFVKDNAQWITEDNVKAANDALATAYNVKDADKTNLKTVDQLAALYETAKSGKTLETNYTTWKTTLTTLQTNAKDAKANDDIYKDIQNWLKEAQTRLDKAIEEANNYVAVYDIIVAADLVGVQNDINTITEKSAEAHESNTSKAYQTSIATLLTYDAAKKTYGGTIFTRIANAIPQIAFNQEYKVLKAGVQELNDQYVLYAADFENADQAAAFKAQIDGWNKELTSDDANSLSDDFKTDADKKAKKKLNKFIIGNYKEASKFPYAALLADLKTIEDAMAKALTDMAEGTANNPEKTAEVYADLTKQLTDLATRADLADAKYKLALDDEAVLKKQADVKDQIADVQALLDENKDDILFYDDVYQMLINNAKTAVENLETNAGNAAKAIQDKIDAEIKEYDKQTAILNAAKKAIEDAKTALDKYTYVKAANFAAKFNQKISEIEELQKTLDGKKGKYAAKEKISAADIAAVTALYDVTLDANNKVTAVNGGSVVDVIKDINATAAKRELTGEFNKLQADLNALTYNDADYTISDLAKIKDGKEAIQAALNLQLGTKTEESNIAKLNSDQLIEALKATKGYKPASSDFEKDGDGKYTGVVTGAATLQDEVTFLTAKIKDLAEFIEVNNLNPDEKASADFNNDGEPDVEDYQLLVDEVVAGTNNADFDLNKDGLVNIVDINTWIEIFNNQFNTEAAARAAFNDNDAATLEVLGTENGVTRLAVNLKSEDAYRGLQLNIHANVVAASATSRAAEGMGLYKGQMANGATCVLLTSMFGKEIAAGEGAVVYLDVTGFTGEAEGMFVNAGGKTITFNLVTGEVTAIDGVEVETGFMQKVYNLGGKLMDGLKKGINIIRNSDGSTKKVVVK